MPALSMGEGRHQKELERVARKVEDLSERFESMSDEELGGMTAYFRERYRRGETLDELLPEAFAAVREASGRALGMRHFPVQLMGGVVLHRGMIAEMRTGEGKTLVAPLAAYLNAIPGKGVHIVTVNDYLASRDSEWMGKVYGLLGMKVGCLQNDMDPGKRRGEYLPDVTYGTNSEFGFDYLRDNMAGSPDQRVQRGHSFAIVDEADSILIDEARTPLIISGVDPTPVERYIQFARRWRGSPRTTSRWTRPSTPSTLPRRGSTRSRASSDSTSTPTHRAFWPTTSSRRSWRASSSTGTTSTWSLRARSG